MGWRSESRNKKDPLSPKPGGGKGLGRRELPSTARQVPACPPAAWSPVPAALPWWMKGCLLGLPGGSALILDSLMTAPRAREEAARDRLLRPRRRLRPSCRSRDSRFRRRRHRGGGGARGALPRPPRADPQPRRAATRGTGQDRTGCSPTASGPGTGDAGGEPEDRERAPSSGRDKG